MTKTIFTKNFLMFSLMLMISTGSLGYAKYITKKNKLLKQENIIFENNSLSKLDSIKTYYNKKLDAKEFEKRTLMVDRDNFKNENSELSKKISKLSNNIQYYSDLVTSLNGRIGKLETNIKLNDSLIVVNWENSDIENGFEQSLKGTTKINYNINDGKLKLLNNSTFLSENITKMSLNIRQESVINNGKPSWKVIVSSPSKRFVLDNISSVYFIDKQTVIKKKDKMWSFGPCISYGLTADGKSNFSVGVSLQYNLFKLF